jgi:hypothetical protein
MRDGRTKASLAVNRTSPLVLKLGVSGGGGGAAPKTCKESCGQSWFSAYISGEF